MDGSTTIATPIPPAALVKHVRRLGELLEDLDQLQPGLPPGLETLKRNVLLALDRPESLESPENQLDFVEEFAEALWEDPFPDLLGHPASSWPGAEKVLDPGPPGGSWKGGMGNGRWPRARVLAQPVSPQPEHRRTPSVHRLSTGC